MVPRTTLIAAMSLMCAAAQAPEARKSASEYPAHAEMKGGAIGAENLGHGIMTQNGVIAADDHLVVEVALYSKSQSVDVSAGQFSLRINGKGRLLLPESPGMVAASIKYPDWERTPPEVMVGAGDAGVIFGGPNTVPRFPGDRRPMGAGVPNPVPPVSTTTAPVEKQPQEPIEDQVKRWSLPEGNLGPPICGYLYFSYKRKLKSIKALELLYDGPLGRATLPLR